MALAIQHMVLFHYVGKAVATLAYPPRCGQRTRHVPPEHCAPPWCKAGGVPTSLKEATESGYSMECIESMEFMEYMHNMVWTGPEAGQDWTES